MSNYKVFLIRLFTFVGGLYFVSKFILPEENGIIKFKDFHEYVINGFTVIGSMAIGLGILNLLLVHGGKIAFKKSGWAFSAVLLVGLGTMLLAQGLDWYNKEKNARRASSLSLLSEFSKKIVEDATSENSAVLPRTEREQMLKLAIERELINISKLDPVSKELKEVAIKIEGTLKEDFSNDLIHKQLQDQIVITSNLYREEIDKHYVKGTISQFASFLNQGLFVSLGSAMFSLLGFYIAAAAYRAFRVRSVEATLMMLAALIVMLGQIPYGIWISPHLPEIRMWLLQVPSAGAARAIEMGAAIAGLVLAIRMWLSLESGSFKS